MNNTTRVLMAALLCTAAIGCSKKVQETPPPVDTTPAPVTQTPTTPGAYTPADLDTDACLRQRVV